MNLGVFKRRIDVDAEIQMTPLKSLYASGDKDAHVFELSLYRGTTEMDLSGASAQGYFIRADGYTVPITGAISGNVVTLTLSEGCYYVVGNFNLIIKVSTAESRKSVFWGNGYVVRSMTDAIVDEENVIPSLDELLAQIAAAESAAKAANQAASAANSAATSATQAASAADANASAANSAANAATAAASSAAAAATKIDDMTISATGLAAGAAPTAKLTEVDGHYNIVLGLPKGDKGDTGATPQITVQVKTSEPGTAASVKQTGTAEAPVIELTIPRGDTGSIGSLTINGKAPDAAGKVELTAADVGALSGTDATLTEAGKAADAKATGDEINQLKIEIEKKWSSEVLWENAAPNSAFDEQTITFDWKGYNYCMIYFLAYVNSNVRSFSAVAKKGDRLRFYFLTDTTQGAGGQFRDFDLDTSHFGKAVRLTDSTSDDQRACIPVRIYGVKGV